MLQGIQFFQVATGIGRLSCDVMIFFIIMIKVHSNSNWIRKEIN